MELKWQNEEKINYFRCANGCQRVLLPRRYRIIDCGNERHRLCVFCEEEMISAEKPLQCPVLTCAQPILRFKMPNTQIDGEFDQELSKKLAYCPQRNFGCFEAFPFKDFESHLKFCHVIKDNKILLFMAQIMIRELQYSTPQKKEAEKFEEVDEARQLDAAAGIFTDEEKAAIKLTRKFERLVVENINQIIMEYHLQIKEGKSRESADSKALCQLRALLDKSSMNWRPSIFTKMDLLQGGLTWVLFSDLYNFLIKNVPEKCQRRISGEEYKFALANKEFKYTTSSNQMTKFNLVNENGLFEPTFQWTINPHQSHKLMTINKVTSEPFDCPGYPFRARVTVSFFSKKSISAAFRFYDDQDNEKEMDWPRPRVYGIVDDNKCRELNYWGHTYFLYSRKSINYWSNIGSSDKKNLSLKIYVESPPMAVEIQAYDGNLDWFMEGYSRRVESERDGLCKYQQSPYLCTSFFGYKIQLRAQLFEKDNKAGNKFTIDVCFLDRSFNCKRFTPYLYSPHPFPPDPFPHQLCLSVVKRKEPYNSIIKLLSVDGERLKDGTWSSYEVDVCEAKDIKDYVQDNALLINVRIIG